MSTRSNIGIREADGSVSFVYCHFDGYPSHHGPILTQHYASEAAVRELLALGDLSALRPRVSPALGEAHSYSRPIRDVVIAYHRDRGEELREATAAPNADMLPVEEYAYLWDVATGGWIWRSDGSAPWTPLTPGAGAEA